MFSSRKRGRKAKAFTPSTAATVDPNAATAAVSAYNLSAAAAAAALRALPSAPIDVSAVQTKRNQRRSVSVSSTSTHSRRALSPVPSIRRAFGLGDREQTSARVASPVGMPALRRRGSTSSIRSVSSMSERTFRSPSPHQSLTGSRSSSLNVAGAAAALAVGRSAPAPPVPSIPRHVIDGHQPTPIPGSKTKKSYRKSTSSMGLVQQPLRLASQQQTDNTPWFAPATIDMGSGRTSDLPAPRTSDDPDHDRPMSPVERPGSRSSLHFSYPSRQRLSSPPASPAHSRNTSLTEPIAVAAPPPQALKKASSAVRSVSNDRAHKHHPSHAGHASAATGTRRSASTSRLPGHTRAASADQELVYDPNSRRMIPRSDLLRLERAIFEAEREDSEHDQHVERPAPVPKKKKRQPVQKEAAPQPTKTKTAPPEVSETPEPTPAPAPIAEESESGHESEPEHEPEPVLDNIEEEPVQPVPGLTTSASTPESSVTSLPALAAAQATPSLPVDAQNQVSVADASGKDAAYVPDDHRPALMKRPSVVREDPEGEEEAQLSLPSESETSRSHSPARTAHFAPVAPVAGASLDVRRHSPPPRSVSPRKSALKQPASGSPRDASPSDASDVAAPFAPLSPADTTTRKKAHRVSFNDNATVLAAPAILPSVPMSPTVSSLPGAPETADGAPPHAPAKSRSWFSNMGRTKKKAADDAHADDDAVVMGPRPALPSFGSVRGRSVAAAQPEERPLVVFSANSGEAQPVTRHAPCSPVPVPVPLPSVLKSPPPGASSDHALGPILAGPILASPPRNTANTSRQREPLPPVVTSVDGSGYVSDSGASLNSEYEVSPIEDAPNKKTRPEITISHPSQERVAPCTTAPQPSPVRSVFDVPGTFPDTESDTTKASPRAAAAVLDGAHAAVPVRTEAFEPITQDDDVGVSAQTPATVAATHMPTLPEEESLRRAVGNNDNGNDDNNDDNDESSGSDVFSDAYEDLSDIEGDGFLSLDAIVESPVVPTFAATTLGSSLLARPGSSDSAAPAVRHPESASLAGTTVSSALAAPVVAGAAINMPALMASAVRQTAGAMDTIDPDDQADWDKVKAFWRNLSAEKRAQLEREALDDAAADGDLEEAVAEDKKPRRKKSVEKRHAEKQAIHERLAARPASQEKAEFSVSPVRMRRSMRGAPDNESRERPVTHHRRGSDSSESSFQRAPGATFRKSMRGPAPAVSTHGGNSNNGNSLAALTQANTAANENLARRGSRFSLRSLSPGGSTTVHGSVDSSPQFRRTLREEAPKRPASLGSGMGMSSGGGMSNATLRRGKNTPEPTGFFSSLGRKSGTKLLQRSKVSGSSSRFDSSDDDDIFGPGAAAQTTGTGAYTFRSRFGDSSDDDEAPTRTLRPTSKGKGQAQQAHTVPRTLRSTAPVPTPVASQVSSPAPVSVHANRSTNTLRRQRSGRGQVPTSPGYATRKHTSAAAAAGAAAGAAAADATMHDHDMPPVPAKTHRRASSIMSVLRRKKPDAGASIGRGTLVDSAARRDTALERTSRELQAVRTTSRTENDHENDGGDDDDESEDLPSSGDEDPTMPAARISNSWPRVGARPAPRPSTLDVFSDTALNVDNSTDTTGLHAVTFAQSAGTLPLPGKKKKFPALRRMFRLDE